MSHPERTFVRPTSHHDRVKRLEVVSHNLPDFVVPHQPVDRIVLTREIVVETICAAKNNFAHGVPFGFARLVRQRSRLRRSRAPERLRWARRLHQSKACRARWLRSIPRCDSEFLLPSENDKAKCEKARRPEVRG